MRVASLCMLMWVNSLAGCFDEAAPVADMAMGTTGPAGDDGDDGDTTPQDGGDDDGMPTGGTDGAGGTSATTTSAATSDATDDATVDDTASTDDGAVPTFCDEQPENVVLCRDFDGESPLAGFDLSQPSGMVTTTKDPVVSEPRAMQASVMQDFEGSSAATAGHSVVGAPLPFDGRFSTWVFIDPGCMVGSGERFVMSMSFFDAENLVNFTLWFTATETILYSSTEPQGFPSIPHPIGAVLPTDAWVELSLDLSASSPDATLTIDGMEHPIVLQTWSDGLATEIADVAPSVTVGTIMAAGQADCTMVFDDVVVSARSP